MRKNNTLEYTDIKTLEDLRKIVADTQHFKGESRLRIKEPKTYDPRDSDPSSITVIGVED